MTDTATPLDTRQQILDAAMDRISHYGYSKTTMSEIARDCNMSAGNIYRFFASKIDIAEAMAAKFNAEIYETYAKIGAEPLPATERLAKIFHYALDHTFTAIAEDDKILEVAEVLKRDRPLYMNNKLAEERTILSPILEDGIASGEIKPGLNTEEVIEFMQAALMKFRFPQLFSQLTLPKLKRELNGVLTLIFDGIRTPES